MDFVAVHHVYGAHFTARDGTYVECPSIHVPEEEMHGANGAGDAFAAGFFYGRYRDWSPMECLRMGHAAAAACIRAPGTSEAVEDYRHCLALAEKWGWREPFPA